MCKRVRYIQGARLLETMAEAERLIDALTVKLPVTVRVALENMARANYMSMSEVAREYIIDGLRNDGVEI